MSQRIDQMARQHIVSANRLNDGRIVFLDAHRQWVSNIDHSCVVDAGPALDELMGIAKCAEANDIIVSIESVEVEISRQALHPVRLRDRIRIGGPSISGGKQKTAPAPGDPGNAIDPGI